MRRYSNKASALVAAMILFMAAQVVPVEPPSAIRIETSNAHLYPIGWSRDGAFAYGLVDSPPFRQGFGFRYAIVDARTDAVLWTRYEHSDTFEWQGEGVPLVVAWDRSGREVTEQLARFEVELTKDAGLSPFPLRRGTDEYTVEVTEWLVNPETSPYGNDVVGYTLVFRSRERGSKIIAQRSHIFATRIEVLGHIRSPFENRLVLLVSESGNAYGQTEFTDFAIVGAHLDVGFE